MAVSFGLLASAGPAGLLSPSPPAVAGQRSLSMSASSGQLSSFNYDARTRVVYGNGVLQQLPDLVREYHGSRVLLVSDPGIRDAGHEARAVTLLRSAGLSVTVFDDVTPNPSTDDVQRGVAVARDARIDFLVGLGGGSSIDVAKGINFLVTNGGQMEDYRGHSKATRPMLPLIAVPTTAGTGSEAQSFAVIADARTHMKMACGDKKAAARVALLDPELSLTMPASVTAVTGIDAVSHAIESYVTTLRNPVSMLFSREAWRLLRFAFPRVLDEPQDCEARGMMLLGAHLAGAAIENSMLGAAHALANPLSAHFGLIHGVAIGLMLPTVIRFNAAAVGPRYAELWHGRDDLGNGESSAALRLAEFVEGLTRRAGLPQSLDEAGVDADMIPVLAAEAAQQWTGQFNPRPAAARDFEELYRCVSSSSSGQGR